MTKKIFVIATTFISSIAYASDVSWWLYNTDSEACVPSPGGDIHPQELVNTLKSEEVSVALLTKKDSPEGYVYLLTHDDGSIGYMPFTSEYSECETIGLILRNSLK